MKPKQTKFWKWKNQTVRNQATEETAERTLFLYGAIADESWFDDDVTPKMFRDELFTGNGPITVYINSPGGDCVAASQIYTMLMDYKNDVTIKIDGIAASAASVIVMAGTKVLMTPTAIMMIHDPLTVAIGDSTELQKAIEMLDEVKESIINAYEIKTGLSRAKISHLMSAETWMDTNKAVELGFADAIMYTDKGDENDEDKETFTAMMFSRRAVTNSLVSKLTKAYSKTQNTEEKHGRSFEELYDRLNLIKN